MVRRLTGRPWFLTFAVLAVALIAAPAFAQGRVQGVVEDDKGQPIEGATVTVESTTPGRNAKFTSKTNKNGEYIQIGLAPGAYKVTAEKDKLASAPVNFNASSNRPATVKLTLNVAAAAVRQQAEAVNKMFQEGQALLDAGNRAGAIEKFTAAAEQSPNCSLCYVSIGSAYSQDKDWEKAEAAYKKATEINANDPDAYNGLATVYNNQRKFEEAAAASKKAAELSGGIATAGGGGGNADAVYNQGVSLFNAGKSAEAKPLFEQVIQMNPSHAEAHYMHGMTIVAENPSAARAEFEKYLELAPTGKYADNAKLFASQLPK